MNNKAEGSVLKKLRVMRGISQTELADKCGLSQTSISLFETGVTQPKGSTVEKVAKALRVSELAVTIFSLTEKDVAGSTKEVRKAIEELKSLIWKSIINK